MADASTAKKELRQRVLAQLQAAAANDTAGRRSTALRSLLKDILENKPTLHIALYHPLPHEVNLLPLLQEYPQHHYYFPRCLPKRQMEFRKVVSPKDDFIQGHMGIAEPCAHCQIISPEKLDILIMPGVAFTRAGKRLGYGGGYYDRYVPRCTNASIMSLAFAEQLVNDLPQEEHDVVVPHIICLG